MRFEVCSECLSSCVG